MSLEQMKKAASMGAKLELCAMGPLMGPAAHYEWMRHWREVKIEETVAAVKEVGVQSSLATDLGQQGRNYENGPRSYRSITDGLKPELPFVSQRSKLVSNDA